MRHDPRIRQNLDRISTRLESAADNARTGCFTFTSTYVEPCLSSLVNLCTSCIPHAKSTHNHHHHRYRPAEFPFGFYDYDDGEEEEETRGFLSWGTDELDRLLAGSGGPERERMHYGAVANELDPTVIPATSMFGFLGRFGGRKGMRYKPSAANLQEHPQRGWRRQRSGTESSQTSQGDSLRSRGDLWPSEDEDDAVVIEDDVFLRGSGTDEENYNEVVGFRIGEGEGVGKGKEVEYGGWREGDRRRIRGKSTDSMEENRTRKIYSGSKSAPPMSLATSPEPYSAMRPGSLKSSYLQHDTPRPGSPRGKEKEVIDRTSTPRPQMRQVSSTNSPLPTTPQLRDTEVSRAVVTGDDDIDDGDDA